MDTQLKKGILEICILYQLSQKDLYGYSLIQQMKQLFPDVYESTFYAILRRLNKEGMTKIYFGMETNGPTRKYYHLTELGEVKLKQSIGEWQEIRKIMENMGI